MTSVTEDLPIIDEMRAGQIKKELESYGISTVSFLEKKELVEALTKARADGLKPKATKNSTASSSSSSSTTSSSSASASASSSSSTDTRPRDERLQEEMAKCKDMKAGELKKELQERGISTKSFFEKSEFVKALAEARVDGVFKKQTAAAAAAAANDEEGYAEYSNVEVLTDESAGPRSKKEAGSASSGASSPFGGGMGGMGGMADMLKNMGMGGGGAGAAGANPFGGGMGGMGGMADMLKNMGMGGAGAGGSPFGGGMGGMDPNMMATAQKMMSNPKVQQILAKAQSNPSIMAKVNECMSNPASFAKYQNDPDVAELISELKKYM